MPRPLSPERWQIVCPYLDQALTLPETDRPEWLAAIRRRDPGLADDLQGLLVHQRRAADDGFLEQGLQPPAPAGARGEQVGAYRLISPIGEGGMSTVWLAERVDGRFEGRVAIKFLNLSLIGRIGQERFKREGSIVGALAHPHIAHLMDAGVSASGHPYLVLEYVDGEDIASYCDRHALDVRGRVRLFLDVLAAVAHAHANLIVHRDLKPSNILVRSGGDVKLLDFGIAKLLDPDPAPGGGTELTREGGTPLTPEYASPEQLRGGPQTTATDIYSAGAVLYRVLTGVAPRASRTSEADLIAPADTIEPEPPGRLNAQVPRDLDFVLARALRHEPSDRYESAHLFADDLRAFLEWRPVRAREGSARYRARTFVRRHRAPVASAALVVVAITAGLIATLAEARAAKRQRDFAIHQLSRAEAINDLNNLVLEGTSSDDMKAIDRAERIIAQQQDVSLADRVEVLIALGRGVDVSKDGGSRAHQLLDQAYRLSRGLSEPSTRARAACALAGEVSYGADAARSEALVREALDALPNEPEFALDRVFCLQIDGAVSRAKGAGGEAITRLQLAQRLLKEAPIPSWRLEFLTGLDLGNALRLAGRLDEACTQFEDIAARLAAEGRGDTGAAASVYYGWGVSLSQLGRPLEAEKLIHRAIAIDGGGEDAPGALPWQLIAHAAALRDLGRLDEAAAQAERAYASSLSNGDDARVNQALLLRASIYRTRGDFDRVPEMLDAAEARLARSTPAGHITRASLLFERALAAQTRGDLGVALQRINEALAVANASVDAGRQGTELIPLYLTCRSEIERLSGSTDDAVRDADTALTRIEKAARRPGTYSLHAARAYLALGRALKSQGRDVESRNYFRLSSEHFEKSSGRDVREARQAPELAAMTRQ
ncbi:MAG TPA: serine/threonine-protein kinase [Vicinamibacterales bacterium]|jgi:tetratricopeptide (TPR) repeat protein/tRNA A-37 threonylcarbamoyl transferase component Bud32|nr:serine/threonine-protein kinase [Vicinamibacterales bacterium]